MARKKSKEDIASITSLPILNEDMPLQMLLQRVNREDSIRKERTTEQKIIALKILVLNNMQWSATAKQVGVDRKTIHKWWVQYGELIKKIEPEESIIKNIEKDVAIAKGTALTEWYGLLDDSAKRLRELVNQSTGTRSIYAIVEAVKTTTEVIKLNKEVIDSGKPKDPSFFMNVFNTMIDNKYGKQD